MTVPERIGKYTIASVLGQGAMGVVYKAFDPHIQRPVAIKVIHKALLGDDEAKDSIAARFRNEAQAVGRIAHPGVVAIYDFGEDQDTAYIAMEFVEGRNLDQVLAGTPMLPEAQLLRIMDQVLDALAHAHAQGVWHRDIKPANLLLTANGQVKLTDFGIARIENMGLTQVNSMIGTPGYMAPEQYIGEGIDHRADIFASGVMLYRMLTGKPAFTGASEQVMYKIMNEQAAAPSQVTQGQRPAAYDAVVARAMAKKAADRFASAQEFRQALMAAANAPNNAGSNSDATVIVPAGQWANAVNAAGTPFPAPRSTASPSSMTQTAPITGWDVQTLSRIEKTLASYVGPMAKLMVREAARHCTDVGSLAVSVSQHISEDKERQQFISTATGGSQASPRTGATALAPSPTGAGAKTGFVSGNATQAEPLTDEFKAHAAAVLTRHMGPIAKVMVKRAAERSVGKSQFIQTLLDTATDVDRATLERELLG